MKGIPLHPSTSGNAPENINTDNLPLICDRLAAGIKPFAEVLRLYGYPPLWQRPADLPTLIYIILEQQVSLSSARAACERLEQRLKPFRPEDFLELSDAELKTIGFSRQKTRYSRLLCQTVINREFNFETLPFLDDESVCRQLQTIPGIGPWTCSIFLLMSLGRPDIWPNGDIALRSAWQMLTETDQSPDHQAMQKAAENWRPYRSVAARLLWHYYLQKKGIRL